jgi:hypothetical protein
VLLSNEFTNCKVNVNSISGNVYGGGVSVYMGGYASISSSTPNVAAEARVGETVVHNVSVVVDTARFSSCSAVRFRDGATSGAHAYGGSFSFYIGAYAYSRSTVGSSTSESGATNATNIIVDVRYAPSSNSSAMTQSFTGNSLASSASGGSFSALHVGSYAVSESRSNNRIPGRAGSISTCRNTTASGIVVGAMNLTCSNCAAQTNSDGISGLANAYGGSISALHVGAYAWSLAAGGVSQSTCEATTARDVMVGVSDSSCSNCSAQIISASFTNGAKAYGGSISALHVGAYAWSASAQTQPTSRVVGDSSCGATTATGIVAGVSNSSCTNCVAQTNSGAQTNSDRATRLTKAYGGSISALHVGAYAWSLTANGVSQSTCEATTARDVMVGVSDSSCSNCSAQTISTILANGAKAYGGSISALHVGAYAWSWSQSFLSSSRCEMTDASGLNVSVNKVYCRDCRAQTTLRSASFATAESYGAIAYGGSISLVHVGAFALSTSFETQPTLTRNSSSCGVTTATGIVAGVSNSSCSNCAAQTNSDGISGLANAYGGSISALHVGAYAWSLTAGGVSQSTCEATTARDVMVGVSDSSCSNCSAQTISTILANGAKAYGGSISALHVGAYAWSWSQSFLSSSRCEMTDASGLNVSVNKVYCRDCRAQTTLRSASFATAESYGAIAYGGSISLVHVGAFAWSLTDFFQVSQEANFTVEFAISSCEATSAIDIVAVVSDASCIRCLAFISSENDVLGGNVYGGSIRAVHVGGLSLSHNPSLQSSIRSTCKPTLARGLNVTITDVNCSKCTAEVRSFGDSVGTNVIGGFISALYVGAYAWSVAHFASSACEMTHASGLNVKLNIATCFECSARTTSYGSSFGANVYGGSISAIYVGAYALSRRALTGRSIEAFARVGDILVENTHVALISSMFSNCLASSFTTGFSGGSLEASDAFGGAVSIVQSPQVFSGQPVLFRNIPKIFGFNFTVHVLNSHFFDCRAITYSSSLRPGAANGGGGAVYARSPAFSSFSMRGSRFNSSYVQVLSGVSRSREAPAVLITPIGNNSDEFATAQSNGGAVAVEAQSSNDAEVDIASSSFFNCSAWGANVGNLVVRGGSIAVLHVASVVLTNTTFIRSRVLDANRDGSIGGVVSGGAGLSVAHAKNVRVQQCVFDATDGQDSSETSTGLLVLASDSSRTRMDIAGTSFISPSVVLRFECVDSDGVRSIACISLNSISISVRDSSVQYQQSDLNRVAQQRLLSFGNGISESFSRFRMQCLNSQFSVIKEISQNVLNGGFVEYSCGPCRDFKVSLTGNNVYLEKLNFSKEVKCAAVSSADQARCPFGVSACSTFVSVSRGFWSNFADSNSNPSDSLKQAVRCPPGYCRCQNAQSECSCLLMPLHQIDRNPDQLCHASRSGTLCGGCRANYTQSWNERTCIHNDVCRGVMWWLWTASIIFWVLYSLYIVYSCSVHSDNSISCVLFYLQVALFASSADDEEDFSAILQMSQVRSLLTYYDNTCYAPDMSAYNMHAAKLIGPLFVLVFSVAWTWILQALQPRLQRRNIRIQVSYSGTLVSTILFCFSSVAQVVFTLVECTRYDTSGFVFIDGTVSCLDGKWILLIVVIVLLCLFPVAFAAALWFNKLPENARAVVCRSFTEPTFYWEALTLFFRLMIALLQFLNVSFPNALAFARMLLSNGMLLLLMTLRPHILDYTHWVDVVCYACLSAQFALQTILASIDFFAVVPSTDQERRLIRTIGTLIQMFRFAA